MKLNRNSKKWKDCFNEKLKELVDKKGVTKKEEDGQEAFCEGELLQSYEDTFMGRPRIKVVTYRTKYKEVDAMPDRIKEAEEYADRLFSAMR